MTASSIQQMCKDVWKPFQKSYSHLSEDAISTAVVAVLEAYSVNSTFPKDQLERIARNAILDYIEENS